MYIGGEFVPVQPAVVLSCGGYRRQGGTNLWAD
jgi:hypothetical protein